MYNEENSKKLDYQIGGLVGSLIWTRMGHLWIDSHNPPVAGVATFGGLKELDNEDTIKWTTLSDAWYVSHQEDQRNSPYEESWKFDHSEKSENLWKNLKQLERELRDKYLPNPFVYREEELNISNIKDMDLFLDGLITYLWNTDFCQYSLKKEDIQIIPNDYSTEYIFKFDQDEEEVD